jgi:hypothetical protein
MVFTYINVSLSRFLYRNCNPLDVYSRGNEFETRLGHWLFRHKYSMILSHYDATAGIVSSNRRFPVAALAVTTQVNIYLFLIICLILHQLQVPFIGAFRKIIRKPFTYSPPPPWRYSSDEHWSAEQPPLAVFPDCTRRYWVDMWSAHRIPQLHFSFPNRKASLFLLLYSSYYSVYPITRLSGPRSRPNSLRKILRIRESNPGPLCL